MKTVADGQSLPTGENSGPAFDIYQNRDIRHPTHRPNRLCSSTEVNGVSPEKTAKEQRRIMSSA